MKLKLIKLKLRIVLNALTTTLFKALCLLPFSHAKTTHEMVALYPEYRTVFTATLISLYMVLQ